MNATNESILLGPLFNSACFWGEYSAPFHYRSDTLGTCRIRVAEVASKVRRRVDKDRAAVGWIVGVRHNNQVFSRLESCHSIFIYVSSPARVCGADNPS